MQIDKNQLLHEITDLSHEFGTTDYVCGGGGNTSVKNDTTLWVKPSGTTLGGLKPELFVALNRTRLAELYDITPPQDPSAREALIKEKMSAALLPGQTRRPSVEAPLHDSLSARFIVHTHPALVNGMTCAKEGAAACGHLFPEALWLDYIDPGYTLCIAVRQRIRQFRAEEGREPSLIFLKNHGVFVAGSSPQEIRDLYATVCNRLLTEYANANISVTLNIPPLPEDSNLAARRKAIRRAFADDNLCIAASGPFQVPAGPLSPDHIVYAKSYPLTGEPAPAAVAEYKKQYGYPPQILVSGGGVFAVGASEKKAALALQLAQNGALVQHLAAAFGGVEYMTDRARRFIEGWEVESYRSSQIQ